MPHKTDLYSQRVTDSWMTTRNGTPTGGASVDSYFQSYSEVVSAIVPNWQRNLRMGLNATGEMVATFSKVRFKPMFASGVFRLKPAYGTWVDTEERQGRQSSTLPNPPAFPNLTENADRQARSRHSKLAIATQRGLQGGVILGEIIETMRMLKRPATAMSNNFEGYLDDVVNITRQARRQKRAFNTVGKVNAQLRNAWLSQTYGWAPLISDTRAAAELLAEKHMHLSREVKFINATGIAESAVTYPMTTVTQGKLGWAFTGVAKRLDKVLLKSAMAGTTDSPLLRTMSDLGFSLEDFVPTMWELIPYSFVVDYFTNTGEVLDAWSHRSIRFEWSQRTTVNTVTSTRSNLYSRTKEVMPAEWDLIGETLSSGKYQKVDGTITRERVTNRDVQPEFHFEIPGIRQTFNTLVLTDGFRRATEALTKLFK